MQPTKSPRASCQPPAQKNRLAPECALEAVWSLAAPSRRSKAPSSPGGAPTAFGQEDQFGGPKEASQSVSLPRGLTAGLSAAPSVPHKQSRPRLACPWNGGEPSPGVRTEPGRGWIQAVRWHPRPSREQNEPHGLCPVGRQQRNIGSRLHPGPCVTTPPLSFDTDAWDFSISQASPVLLANARRRTCGLP